MDEHQEETLFDEIEIDLRQLKVFDRQDGSVAIPEGFTSATIYLDAKPSSSLNWASERKATQALIDQGYKVLFELDLGLLGVASQPLTHTGQFQTHVLAINEFVSRFLEEFQKETVGVILYRSKNTFKSHQERDVMIDYLELLRAEIWDHIPCFLLFDCKELQNPFAFIRLFALDRFSLFTLALANAPVPLNCLIWQPGALLAPNQEAATIGLLMPRFDYEIGSSSPQIGEALTTLLQEKRAFKIIPEGHLPLEWDGLDELIVYNEGLLPTTLRAIDGFEAAGGTVLAKV